ncbi:MAG: T9SS type A sorting domain-containing protein [Saprospiraceae bacterium]
MKQIDLDDQSSMTGIIAVNFKPVANKNLAFYPNPVIDILTISEPIEKEAIINIYSTDGCQVDSKKIINNTNKINVSHLHSGVYILEFINGEKIKTSRFIK